MENETTNQPITSEAPCIVCGKILTVDICKNADSPCEDIDSSWKGYYVDVEEGASAIVYAGYGSQHDFEIYALVLCDECITKNYQAGRLKFVHDSSDCRLTKPLEFLTDDERKALGIRTDAEVKALEEHGLL
jgi:hypothetical protein